MNVFHNSVPHAASSFWSGPFVESVIVVFQWKPASTLFSPSDVLTTETQSQLSVCTVQPEQHGHDNVCGPVWRLMPGPDLTNMHKVEVTRLHDTFIRDLLIGNPDRTSVCA